MDIDKVFHVKHDMDAKLASYKEQIEIYHQTLDLMSDIALERVDDYIQDALQYAEVIEKYMPEGTIIDVGSGVGLPGIVLALALPQRTLILAERRRKRCAFLSIVASKLELSNVEIHKSDVREVKGVTTVVCAQAVADLDSIYRLTQHLHAHEVLFISRKGDDWQRELATLNDITPVTQSNTQVRPLNTNGTLVSVRVRGGQTCPS